MLNFIVKNYRTVLLSASTVILIISTCLSLTGGHTYLRTAVHDMFIPINASYAVESGLTLHSDFHTPFGWIYPVLCYSAAKVINTFPSLLTDADINVITGVIFNLSLAFIYLLLNICAPSKLSRIPYLLLLLVLVIPLQPSTFGSMRSNSFNWLGMYNKQLWALSILQLVSTIYWSRSLQSGSRRSLAIFACFQSLFIYYCFHYKISFFLSSFLFSLIPLLSLNLKRALTYLAILVIVLTCALLLTDSFSYSYQGYFNDILLSIEAYNSMQSTAPLGSHLISKPALTAFLLFCLLLAAKHGTYKKASFLLSRTKKQLIKYCYDTFVKVCNLRGLLQFLIVVLSVSINLKGDHDQPTSYLYLISAIFFISPSRRKLSRVISTFVLSLALTFGLLSFLKASYYKHYNQISRNSKLLENDIQKADGSVIRLATHRNIENISLFKVLECIFPNEIQSQSDFSKLLNIATSTCQMGSYQAQHEYCLVLNEHIDYLNSLNLPQETKVQLLSFVNPLPALTKLSFPTPTDHWIHIGKTHTLKRVQEAMNSLKSADLLILPVTSYSPISQAYLNASFVLWNSQNGSPFKVVNVTRNAFYLSKESNTTPSFDLSISDLEVVSSNLEELQLQI